MDIKNIDQRFSIAGQLNETDLEDIARQGFKLVINFRPDGEGGETQPHNAVLAAKARELGLDYAYLPVVPNQIQASDIEKMHMLLARHEGPVLGFCRTGNRANSVYQQTLQTIASSKPACCQSTDESQNMSSRLLNWIKR